MSDKSLIVVLAILAVAACDDGEASSRAFPAVGGSSGVGGPGIGGVQLGGAGGGAAGDLQHGHGGMAGLGGAGGVAGTTAGAGTVGFGGQGAHAGASAGGASSGPGGGGGSFGGSGTLGEGGQGADGGQHGGLGGGGQCASIVAGAPWAVHFSHASTIVFPKGGPNRFATGDVNGDGTVDVVATSAFDNQISVALGTGDGTFGGLDHPAVSIDTPFGIILVDTDSDSALDILLVERGASLLTIIPGKGDGTFGPKASYPTALYPVDLARAHLTAGVEGVVTVNVVGGSISVLLATSTGFGSSVDYQVAPSPVALAIADLNGDSFDDVVVVGGEAPTGFLSVLNGSGDGTFLLGQSIDAGGQVISVSTGDFNEDSFPDVVTANYAGSSVTVSFGSPEGKLASTCSSVIPTAPGPTNVVATDVDQDGHVDLLVVHDSGVTWLFLGRGDGTLAEPMSLKTGSGSLQGRAVDVNLDGRADVIIANYLESTIDVFVRD